MALFNELTIRASRVPDRNDIYIFGDYFSKNLDECKQVDKLALVPTKMYYTDDITSMCTITQEAAQILMDDLYRMGFRPSKEQP